MNGARLTDWFILSLGALLVIAAGRMAAYARKPQDQGGGANLGVGAGLAWAVIVGLAGLAMLGWGWAR